MSQTGARLSALLRTALFASMFVAFVIGYVPYTILRSSGALHYPQQTGAHHWIGIACFSAGVVWMLLCFWDFSWWGKGTPAPIDPPRELVQRRLYRFNRNPMYTGAILVMLGEFAYFYPASLPLLTYIAAFWLATHLFVVFYEEPALRKTFGFEYERYLREVPRWIPHIKR